MITKARHRASTKPPRRRPTRIPRPRSYTQLLAICGSQPINREKRPSISTRRLRFRDFEAEQRGEALLDRARAAEAQGDLVTARARAKEAAQTISDDPFYWYFSAALAIRENDPTTAQSAISKALTLAPSDPTILFEAGHVADFLGDDGQARSYWMRAAGNDPNGEIGKAAAKAVEMLGVTPTMKAQTSPPK